MVDAIFVRGPVPLSRAHAHNDYEHERPLFEALELDFTSVEVDIHLIDGQLLVAHDKKDIQPDRTLQSLYLDPLRSHLHKNHGRVHRKGGAFTLLIDIKSDADSTYRVLRSVLEKYKDMLLRFDGQAAGKGAVRVILSGNRPIDCMANETQRFAAVDGRLADLENDSLSALFPLISDSWTSAFKWRGVGQMPEAESDRLNEIVETAHARNQRIRFWSTPDDSSAARERVWQKLISADVDLISTDDLRGLRQFLLEHDPLLVK
ncbi:phosphatidylinositol-specific phospholipase C/glycerophosphodiester phosphodiesterase family protein [candidate division KSB1 bacterium]|nr:phosphatidylinositol-specific phospholipase C/glycerophosphodiester phosphodiesterase family protein [candidate division KSB1 bacterium]